jgi:hypothetical protein
MQQALKRMKESQSEDHGLGMYIDILHHSSQVHYSYVSLG